MTLVELKQIIKRSSKKHIVIGVFILAFALGLVVLAALGLDKEATTTTTNMIYVMGGLFGFVAFVMIVKSINIRSSVNNDTHPLIKAILNKETDALIWAHALIFKVKGDNITGMKNRNIVMYFKDGARSQMEIKSEKVFNDTMDYFKENFPNVELNYSDEIKRQMKEQYGFK